MISKIRYYVNDQCLLNLYYSFVHSHINYNILNWTSTFPSFLEPINRKVKASIRLISFKNKYEHTKELFLKHGVLPLHETINYKRGNFLWKISKGYVKSPLSDIFVPNRHYPLRFYLPNPNSTNDKNKIVYSCIKYWNTLPSQIRKCTTLNSFNEKHKKHLLNTLKDSPGH